MPDHPTGPDADRRLTTLLEVEQHLERRMREREARAAERIAAAREALAAARTSIPDVSDEDRASAAADEAAHRAAVDAITAESEVAIAAVARVSDEVIDVLARRALARALGGPT
jgi:hypothetical protein